MEKYFTFTECIGYLASLFVLTSFLMKNIKYIRGINLCGCVTFVTYGFFIDSWPIIISNVAIGVVQIYYLNQLRKEKA
jgi:hypothetical protein